MASTRGEILDMIAHGELKADEAIILLNALARERASADVSGDAPTDPAPDVPAFPGATQSSPLGDLPLDRGEVIEVAPPTAPPEGLWHARLAWLLWAAGGLVVLIVALWLLVGLWNAGWFGAIAAVVIPGPIALVALLVMLYGLLGAGQPWIHVDVETGEEHWPQRIALTLPLPLRPAGVLLRALSGRLPALRRTAIDDVILSLDAADLKRNPLIIDVPEGGKGQQVRLVVGV